MVIFHYFRLQDQIPHKKAVWHWPKVGLPRRHDASTDPLRCDRWPHDQCKAGQWMDWFRGKHHWKPCCLPVIEEFKRGFYQCFAVFSFVEITTDGWNHHIFFSCSFLFVSSYERWVKTQSYLGFHLKNHLSTNSPVHSTVLKANYNGFLTASPGSQGNHGLVLWNLTIQVWGYPPVNMAIGNPWT